MALGDGTAWDEASPTNSSLVSTVDNEIIDLRVGTRLRMAKEHVTPAGSSAGGEHKEGSAVIYVVADEASLPTVRPDGTTAFTTADEGRVALTLDTKLLYYLWNNASVMEWVKFNANTASFSQVAEAYVQLEHRTATGSNGGGTFTADAWRTRPLTDEVSDAGAKCALNTSTNQFTLAAGTYRFRIRVPAYKVGKHQARLKNVSDSTYVYGSIEISPSVTDSQVTWSTIIGRFTIATTKTFEIQHLCQTTQAANGMGVSGDGLTVSGSAWGEINVYTQAEFWREVA